MKVQRDLTWKQLCERAADYGWRPEGFLGYFRKDYGKAGAICVSVYNAGTRRREWLAYLIAEGERADSRFAEGRS